MDSKKILNFCLEQGLLIDRELLDLFQSEKDADSLKALLEQINIHTQTKVITKDTLRANCERVTRTLSNLSLQNQKVFENLKIKLGLTVEISKERGTFLKNEDRVEDSRVEILSKNLFANKKMEVNMKSNNKKAIADKILALLDAEGVDKKEQSKVLSCAYSIALKFKKE